MVSKLKVVCNESGEVFRVLPSDDRASLKDLHKQSGEMPNKRVLPIMLDHGEAHGSKRHGCVSRFP